MNQCNPKTGRYLGNGNGNKSTGFKKGQNKKRQANQLQGTCSRAYVDRHAWNMLEESDKKAWDRLSDQAKTKVTTCHFNKGKECTSQDSEVNQMEAKEHDLIFDDSDDELEAKQHDLLFDDSEEEQEEAVKASKHKVIQVSNAESARKMHEDEEVDFDMMLQAQQANTHLQTNHHELLDSDSCDEESVADLEVNTHNLKKGDYCASPRLKDCCSSMIWIVTMNLLFNVPVLWKKRGHKMQEAKLMIMTKR